MDHIWGEFELRPKIENEMVELRPNGRIQLLNFPNVGCIGSQQRNPDSYKFFHNNNKILQKMKNGKIKEVYDAAIKLV